MLQIAWFFFFLLWRVTKLPSLMRRNRKMSENQQPPVKQRMTPIDLKILTIQKQVKQIDVARKAGVSAGGVSRVFNGIERSKTVENAAAELLEKAPGDIWPLAKLPQTKTPTN